MPRRASFSTSERTLGGNDTDRFSLGIEPFPFRAEHIIPKGKRAGARNRPTQGRQSFSSLSKWAYSAGTSAFAISDISFFGEVLEPHDPAIAPFETIVFRGRQEHEFVTPLARDGHRFAPRLLGKRAELLLKLGGGNPHCIHLSRRFAGQ